MIILIKEDTSNIGPYCKYHFVIDKAFSKTNKHLVL